MTTGKIPRITHAVAIRVLEKAGFALSRQSGKHKIYKNKEGKRVTVSYHSGKIVHPKVLKNILRDANLTLQEFKKLM